MPSDSDLWEALLLPTGVYGESNENEDPRWDIESWRLTAVPKRNPDDEGKVFSDYCMTDIDTLMYRGMSVEQFYIAKPEHGGNRDTQALVLSIDGLRQILLKWTDCSGRGISDCAHEVSSCRGTVRLWEQGAEADIWLTTLPI
jgi:hypothetical protein